MILSDFPHICHALALLGIDIASVKTVLEMPDVEIRAAQLSDWKRKQVA